MMRILGIILEINPFHKGHKYFIEEAIKKVNPDVVVAITSTSFTMRGDVSYLSKFDKTRILLDNLVDLVVELPVSKTLNSADFFAYHSVEILSKIGITDLAFGIENGRTEILNDIVNITSTDEFKKELEISLAKKLSYKVAYAEAFSKVTKDSELIEYLNKPNFTLAIQYINAINKINKDIKIHPINRVDNFYEDTSSQFISAYNLRELIDKKIDFSPHLPYNKKYIQNINKDLLFNLIKYKFLIEQNIKPNHLITEGIDKYIINNFNGNTIEECLNNLANKRYTKSRIKRIMISSLLNIDDTYNQFEDYIRILGFNNKGRLFINSLPKELKNKLKTTLKNDSSKTGEIELSATKLYSLITNINYTLDEFKIPIKKEE